VPNFEVNEESDTLGAVWQVREPDGVWGRASGASDFDTITSATSEGDDVSPGTCLPGR
jgi:hypothetical protein